MRMSHVLDAVLADLSAESEVLEAMVSGLDDDGWRTPTPAAGWTVATQIAHLAWTDEAAVAAATDREAWEALVRRALGDPEGVVDLEAHNGAAVAPADLLARWVTARTAVPQALRDYPDGQKVPWFGPSMSPTSMATARFMETWAHALDVAEALGIEVEPTDRIRHVAHIGVRTRNFAMGLHGLEPPAGEFRIELTAPSGEMWTWGPEDAAQSVRGPAYDFCLRVTQRRHRDDLSLVAAGSDADRWLDVAQTFAGPPGGGREARA
ncbi:TIGR03084 family metal-binding protein [Nakamurella sp.]|uniref:TIGR03084 family metal-binding protein n=1 Tax=Nakamurella sp. TaxID=1869182 RepID=UPI003783385A